MTATIVILGMIAIFLGLRLYSVLGRRTGHEQTIRPPMEQTEPPAPAPVATPIQANARTILADFDISPTAHSGLQAIAGADRTFDLARFVDGAKSAYRMTLEAYWKDDRATLRPLVDDDVYEAFDEAIESREKVGEKLDNRLVMIENVFITDASLNGGMAEITLRFDADIAAITRDKDGIVVAGSLTDAVPSHDSWSFARDVSSSDPNWLIVDTDEAS